MRIHFDYTSGEDPMVIAKNIHPKFSGVIATWPMGSTGPVKEFGWTDGEINYPPNETSLVTIERNTEGELVLTSQNTMKDTRYVGFIDSPDPEACEL